MNISSRTPRRSVSSERRNNINFYALLIVEDGFTMQFVSLSFYWHWIIIVCEFDSFQRYQRIQKLNSGASAIYESKLNFKSALEVATKELMQQKERELSRTHAPDFSFSVSPENDRFAFHSDFHSRFNENYSLNGRSNHNRLAENCSFIYSL